MNTTTFINREGFDHSSDSKEYYQQKLNEVSEKLGGVRNLGAYCQITGIEHYHCITTDSEEVYVHMATNRSEKAGRPYHKGDLIDAWVVSFKSIFGK